MVETEKNTGIQPFDSLTEMDDQEKQWLDISFPLLWGHGMENEEENLVSFKFPKVS